jgi:hypothetical protein
MGIVHNPVSFIDSREHEKGIARTASAVLKLFVKRVRIFALLFVVMAFSPFALRVNEKFSYRSPYQFDIAIRQERHKRYRCNS